MIFLILQNANDAHELPFNSSPPLMCQVYLTTPINEEILSKQGLNGFMDSDEVYASAGYMDPNAFVSNVCVKVGQLYYSYEDTLILQLLFVVEGHVRLQGEQE